MSVLDQIVEVTEKEIRRRRKALPLKDLEARLDTQPSEDRPFSEALTRPGVSVIAEHKRASPSAGTIRSGSTVEEIVTAYERGGAAALSILTEGPHFEGSLDDLRAARTACGLPILRKDFIVDRYQLVESAVAGADAVLLIVAALSKKQLEALYVEAYQLELAVLVEVHDEDELKTALDVVDADIIGINNRNLTDFTVDVERTFELLADVPTGKTVVSESGLHHREQLEDLERVGVDAVLVGESLMRAPDPAAALAALLGHGGDGHPDLV